MSANTHERLIAIGDVHGCRETFLALLAQLRPEKTDRLVLLGDVLDRGPDSRGVIDEIFRLQQEGYSVTTLRGNHEQMLLDVLAYERDARSWSAQGGKETLDSFGVHQPWDIPARYTIWMRQRPYFLEVGPYIFVHAGLNTNDALPLDDTTAMLWLRGWESGIDKNWLGNRVIVYGHTPTPFPEISHQLAHLAEGHILCLDAGCYAPEDRHASGLHRLVAADLSNRVLYEQRRIDVLPKEQG